MPPTVIQIKVKPNSRASRLERNEDGTWVVRSSRQSNSQLEFRFQEGSGVTTIPISGTVKGTAVDMGQGTPTLPSGVTISIRGTSTDFGQVVGHGSTVTEVVSGTVSGNIEFVDTLGHVSTCSKILMDLTLPVP